MRRTMVREWQPSRPPASIYSPGRCIAGYERVLPERPTIKPNGKSGQICLPLQLWQVCGMACQGYDWRRAFHILCAGGRFLQLDLETTIAGESINGKKVSVKRVAKPQNVGSCHILFISSSEQSQLKEILAALDDT